MTVDRCGCKRTIVGHKSKMVFDGSEANSTASACSKHAFLRGYKQKVIGFSFYGDSSSKLSKFRKYFQGIKDNLALVPKYYKGWTVRLYYDLPEEDDRLKDLCEVACNDPNIDLCYVRQIPSFGDISKVFAMNWRFFPMVAKRRVLDRLLELVCWGCQMGMWAARAHGHVGIWAYGGLAI